MRLRLTAAIAVGKILIRLLRLLRRSGTTLPGRASLLIEPALIEHISASAARVRAVISGTNGKTTTSALLGSVLERAGLTAVRNVSGANLLSGVATTLVESADLRGRLASDALVVEVDEATMPLITPRLKPNLTVITNFFRDQLDRFGELDHTVALVRDSLAHTSGVVCINADDPLAAGLAREVPDSSRPLLFGLIFRGGGGGEAGASPSDVQFCPRCGVRLQYRSTAYGHLGDYLCPGCGFHRPTVDVSAEIVGGGGPEGTELRIRLDAGGGPAEELAVSLKIPGTYNAYNALAAAAGAAALGVSRRAIREGLEAFSGVFGRMERVSLPGGELMLALVKNPVGFTEVLRTVAASDRPAVLLLAINDHLADGTDVSWLWDVDFSRFGGRDEIRFVVSGRRAQDMAVRLKYAGVSVDNIEVHPDLREAAGVALAHSRGELPVYALPTYTAMLELRQGLVERGLVGRMWEG
ncbi:MAG: MurT ligase domain-containing protein [Bacillota bacterium]